MAEQTPKYRSAAHLNPFIASLIRTIASIQSNLQELAEKENNQIDSLDTINQQVDALRNILSEMRLLKDRIDICYEYLINCKIYKQIKIMKINRQQTNSA